MKSFYYNDPPRVLSLELCASTPIDDDSYPDVPNDDAQPNCYFCELPMYTLPRQNKNMGIGGGTYNDVCRTCALYEWGC